MVAHPPALLARVGRDDTDDRRAIVGIRPMPLALVGAAPGWVGRVRVRRALFPPRFGTARRPRRPCLASHRSGRSHSGGLESAAAGCGAVSATALIRGRGAPWAHPWQYHVTATPASPGAAVSFRRPFPSAGYSSPHRPDSGKPGNALGRGTRGVRGIYSAGRRAHAGGGGVPAKSCTCCHLEARQSESQSWDYGSTSSTLAAHEPHFFALPKDLGQLWKLISRY
jgi:hypothetical protein